MSTRDHLPDAAAVAARHADLPGLAALLEVPRPSSLLAPLVGERAAASARVERLRLKPTTSVTAAVRVDSPTALLTDGVAPVAAGSWWRVRVMAPQGWASKGAKEVDRARRRHLPSLAVPELRTTVVSAEADRHLPALHRLRPDTGSLVEVAGVVRWTRTLSYNPDRRWVGVAHDVDGAPRELLRWQAGADAPTVLPWTPGRAWTATDAAAHGGALAERLSEELRARTAQERPLRLSEVARFLGALDPGWGDRARRLADRLAPALAALPLAPAHGDLTPDQVVVDDADVHVLDWDRVGLYPAGWDAATWDVGALLTGTPDVPDLPADADAPAVTRAAAHLAYAPDPFRRQLPGWAALTEAVLTRAETLEAR